MNERLIQNLIWKDCDKRRHRFMTPNTTVFGWESDMISVTKAGLMVEYEIKISRGDFRADLAKYRHRVLERHAREEERSPSYFYYAVPRDLIAVSEVPAHAGLIYVHPMFQIVKTAPKLHGAKMTDGQRQHLERSLIHRYWRERVLADFAAGTMNGSIRGFAGVLRQEADSLERRVNSPAASPEVAASTRATLPVPSPTEAFDQ